MRFRDIMNESNEDITDEEAEYLANKYVEIHNKASKEFKEAFKKIGAKMWHDDDAHILKKNIVDFIAKEMKSFGAAVSLRSIYKYPIKRPLTVLDSYPEARVHRPKLDKEVNLIVKKYSTEWEKFSEDFLKNKGIK